MLSVEIWLELLLRGLFQSDDFESRDQSFQAIGYG